MRVVTWAVNSIASTSVVLPALPWPTTATLRMCSGEYGFKARLLVPTRHCVDCCDCPVPRSFNLAGDAGTIVGPGIRWMDAAWWLLRPPRFAFREIHC